MAIFFIFLLWNSNVFVFSEFPLMGSNQKFRYFYRIIFQLIFAKDSLFISHVGFSSFIGGFSSSNEQSKLTGTTKNIFGLSTFSATP